MSCAFGEIIFGWPWTSKLERLIKDLHPEQLEELGIYDFDGKLTSDDADVLGFKTYYNASGDEISGYLGVRLDSMPVYSTCKMSDFKVEPTEEQLQEVLKKRDALPERIRHFLGGPSAWVVWGNS